MRLYFPYADERFSSDINWNEDYTFEAVVKFHDAEGN